MPSHSRKDVVGQNTKKREIIPKHMQMGATIQSKCLSRESNPELNLGRVECYRYTKQAIRRLVKAGLY